MKMKRSIALVVVLLMLAAAMVGCTNKTTEAPAADVAATEASAAEASPVAAADEVVTLTVWGDPDNQAIQEECFKELNALFEEKNPNIKLDYQWSGSFDGINIALQSDTLPDLFWVQGNKTSAMAEMAASGFLLPLDQFNPDPTGFPQGAINYAQVDGVTYCSYPGFIDYALIYYNADLFKANGVEEPKTYSDFVKAMETLDAAGITPFSLGGDFEWSRYWPTQILCATLADQDLYRIIDGEKTGEFSEIVYAFDQFADFCKKGYFGTPAGAMDESSAQLAFSNGKVAMIAEGTWNNSLFSGLDFEVGHFALPDETGERVAQNGYSNFTTYAISSKCENPEAAWKYVEFMYSMEALQIAENYWKSIPAVEGIEVSDPLTAAVSNFQRVGNNIYHVLSNVPTTSGKPQDVFMSSVLPGLMDGSMTGAEGMQRIIDEMNK